MIEPRVTFERRRRTELKRELVDRARAWLPEWRPRDDGGDFALGLLEIVARLESEVTQRLDKIPAKVYRGFLHWLGLQSHAGRAARLPVVFQMAPGADPVLARPPLQMQTTPAQTDTASVPEPVTLETDADLMVSRGSLAALVAVNPSADELFLPPDNFYSLAPSAVAPDTWRVVSEASAGSSQVQLEPELGLSLRPTLRHETSGKQYRVIEAEGALVTIDPALEDSVGDRDTFTRLPSFSPFAPGVRNRQEHALYIGSESVLNLPTDATINVLGLGAIGKDAEWSYWGKAEGSEWNAWQRLEPPTLENQRIALKKRAGAIETREIGGKESRWLRALKQAPITTTTPPVSRIQLTVNCSPGGAPPTCPPALEEDRSTVAVEAIAVTTPLVLDIPFYPLGREPKLFDAFYLGSPEAFSKKNAQVRICLESLDSTTAAYTAARLATGPSMLLVGVAHGNLHRVDPSAASAQIVTRRSSLRPPFSEDGTPSVAAASSPLNNVVDGARVSTLSRSSDTLVAVTSGNDGWLWLQHTQPGQSRWFQLGTIFASSAGALAPDPVPNQPPHVLVLDDGTKIRLIGLNHRRLFEASLPAGWESTGTLPTWREVDDGSIGWAQIVPVLDKANAGGGGKLAHGWLAVDENGDIREFTLDNAGNSVRRPRLGLRDIDAQLAPVAVRIPNIETVLVAKKGDRLIAWSITNNEHIRTLDDAEVDGVIDWVADAQRFAIVFRRKTNDNAHELVTWFAIAGLSGNAPVGTQYVSPPLVRSFGGPTGLSDRLIVPGTNGAVISVPIALGGVSLQALDAAKVESALVFESSTPPFSAGDYLLTQIDGDPIVVRPLTHAPVQNGPDRHWTPLFPANVSKPFVRAEVYRRRSQQTLTGTILPSSPPDARIQLAVGDQGAKRYRYLAVKTAAGISIHSIEEIEDPKADPLVVRVFPEITSAITTITYEYVAATAAAPSILPLLHVDTLDPALVETLVANGVYLKDALPAPNPVLFSHPATVPVRQLVLRYEWDPAHRPSVAGNQVTIVANAIYQQPATLEEPTTGNPTLSWEYWDGTAWWKIPDLVDGTNNLQSTGTVRFCVPEGLQPTDVAGRTSHWIRARLIGGDYGKEKVTIVSTVDANDPKITTQTVDRNLDAIKPPQMASVNLHYSVCCAAWPDFVLTRDGHAVRDQSAANRISEASVELFVPLTETIRRAVSGATSPHDRGRAIYLGFDGKLEGGPIGVLFLVNEGTHDGAFPLEVDVLRERGFERVIAADGTRGLNESGILRFTLGAPPPAVALFGNDTRYWLRVRPSERFTGEWKPDIRAAFLNGAWAFAFETQSPERLGSSDGSPNQRVSVARPPVIEGTLELRVLEPLGDEEVAALNAADATAVIDRLSNGMTGKWVRWKLVDNLVDGDAEARIYALDHEKGDIAFGDGQHGRIPPVGVDSIVAVTYKRGGGDAANDIVAWSQINLVSAIQGVQTVAAPEGAAGGSDPQTPDEVARFAPANLSMRGRALTLRDLEAMAAQFSRDVAQALAFPTKHGARVVVVMRGREPRPGQAVRRELRRYLAARTTPMLASPNAIEVREPEVIEVRFIFELTIDAVESSGAVAADAERRITALLDPAIGGIDETGWKLGEIPGDAEVAAALSTVPHLEEIRKIQVIDASTGATVSTVPRDAIVTLAENGVTAVFAVVEGSPA